MITTNLNLATIGLDDLPDNAQTQANSGAMWVFLRERLECLISKEGRAHAAACVGDSERNCGLRTRGPCDICCMERYGNMTRVRVFNGIAEETVSMLTFSFDL